jgi:UDP-N-acetylmuramate dehydrogenase
MCYFLLDNMYISGSALSIFENVPLAPYTTLGIGGPARFLVRATTGDQILSALDFARARSCPVFVLGGGSNIVVSDDGFPGLVLRIELSGIRHLDEEDDARISAGAGVEWDTFVRYCVKRNLAGIECLSGIPGTVGATPIQNVGAYGSEVGEVISAIRVLDRDTHSVTELRGADCKFGYRSSIFNTTHQNRYIVLKVDFALRSHGKPRISYQDLQQRFAGKRPTISEAREAVLEIRRSKAMVLQEGDADSKSVGSFFKNPILNSEAAAGVEEQARAHGVLGHSESIPRLAAPEGKEKLPAAWLVEHAGFYRGFAQGNAGISSKHSLAFVNRGGASARDFLNLMQLIQARVQALFGIELQPEPVLVGFGKSVTGTIIP